MSEPKSFKFLNKHIALGAWVCVIEHSEEKWVQNVGTESKDTYYKLKANTGPTTGLVSAGYFILGDQSKMYEPVLPGYYHS